MAKNTETEKHLKTVAKGAGYVFVGLIISKILTYFFRWIIARYYGPENYGIVSIGLSLSGILVVLLILGLDSSIVRYVSEYRTKNDKKKIKGALITPFILCIPLSIITAVVFWLFSPTIATFFAQDILTKNVLITVFQAFAFTIPFSVIYGLILSGFIAYKRVEFNVLTDNIFYSIVLLLTVLLFSFFNMGIEGILLSYILTVVTSSLLIFYLFRKHVLSELKGVTAIFETKKMLYYSLPLFIGSIATVSIGSLDTIFIGALKTTTEAGIYNAALPTAKFIIIFSSAFGALFSPIIIEYITITKNKNGKRASIAKKMENELLSFYRTITKWIFITEFPFALLLIFFSKNILIFLFGYEYISGANSLSILGLGFFIYSLYMTSYAMLMAKDKTKYAMATFVLSTLINILLNILLIPSYGILGAAISTMLSSTVLLISNASFAWKITKLNPFDIRAILKSVISGCTSVAFVIFIYRFIGISSFIILLVMFVIYIVVYSFLLLIFRTLDKNDIFILTEIEKKYGLKVKFIRTIFKRFV